MDKPWGGLKASKDKTSSGQRYNKAARGVYFHDEKDINKVLGYAKFATLFSDSTYMQIYLGMLC